MKDFLAAVSGGPDSMALLEMYKRKVFAVCHVNYHDREDTDNDQEIVLQFCNKHNIKCFVLDVTKEMMKNTLINNPQSAYRKVRYDFFCEIAKQTKINKVLVAHNWDDFLETAYMQKEKKSKALFYGLKKISNYKNIVIYRPLLSYSKYSLEKYCVENKVHFATDYTNFSNMYHRNEVRKIIHNFSEIEYKKFVDEINSYNKTNRIFSKTISKNFLEWKKNYFSKKYFLSVNNQTWYYLIYLFLSLNSINKITNGKIKGIIDFVVNGNKNSLYRLKEKIFLSIKNNKLEIVEI
ncbi:MAG: tRNA lysidine(34) synthetase TilS [Mycoplasma sp.]|nr:tRNA lysidine(34) synthetase TilS [Mycoplasma sp.]